MGLTGRERVLAAVLRRRGERAAFTAADIHDEFEDAHSVRTTRNALDSLVEIDMLESTGGTGSAPRFYQFADTEDPCPVVEFIETEQVPKWTFQNPDIREWVEKNISGRRILNACAGKSKLSDQNREIVRNDIDEIIDVDISIDVAELQYHLEHHSFDTIIFDPPYTIYQSNVRYKGRDVGRDRRAKEAFAKLLKPGGRVIELGYHGTCMPARLGFKRVKRAWFNTFGRHRDTLGSIDEKLPEHD